MDLSALIGPRSVEDILAERVRLELRDGTLLFLPALSIEDNEAWLASLDAEFAGLLAGLGAVGDERDLTGIMSLLAGETARLTELLYSYDETGVLPEREELRKRMTPVGLLRAVAEVWRAANPLADIMLAGIASEPTPAVSPPPSSTRRRRTAGPRVKSAAA